MFHLFLAYYNKGLTNQTYQLTMKELCSFTRIFNRSHQSSGTWWLWMYELHAKREYHGETYGETLHEQFRIILPERECSTNGQRYVSQYKDGRVTERTREACRVTDVTATPFGKWRALDLFWKCKSNKYCWWHGDTVAQAQTLLLALPLGAGIGSD